jgi:hypothetical protein
MRRSQLSRWLSLKRMCAVSANAVVPGRKSRGSMAVRRARGYGVATGWQASTARYRFRPQRVNPRPPDRHNQGVETENKPAARHRGAEGAAVADMEMPSCELPNWYSWPWLSLPSPQRLPPSRSPNCGCSATAPSIPAGTGSPSPAAIRRPTAAKPTLTPFWPRRRCWGEQRGRVGLFPQCHSDPATNRSLSQGSQAHQPRPLSCQFRRQ